MNEDLAVAEPAVEAVIEVPEVSNDVSEPSEPVSTRDALVKAFEGYGDPEPQAEPQEAPEVTAEKPEIAEGERERNPDGTFKAKEGESAPIEEVVDDETKLDETVSKFTEAPSRFSPDAKAAWNEASEPIKAEITRAVSELEQGIEQHKQAFEPYREFADKLAANGQDFQTVLGHYTGIEQKLSENPMAGLDQICQNMGFTLRQVAERVMGETPDQAAHAQDQTINELRQQISGLTNKFSGMETSMKSQSEAVVLKQIETFAVDKPRFEELSADMGFFMENGRAKDLQEAYDLAERLNPGASPEPAPVTPVTPEPDVAQTHKGKLSTSGAPNSGSNPATKKPPSSPREALKNAFASVGI